MRFWSKMRQEENMKEPAFALLWRDKSAVAEAILAGGSVVIAAIRADKHAAIVRREKDRKEIRKIRKMDFCHFSAGPSAAQLIPTKTGENDFTDFTGDTGGRRIPLLLNRSGCGRNIESG